MKIKTITIILTALTASSLISNGASVIISNAFNGPGDSMNSVPADTLYALKDNSLMAGGIVAVGYFGSMVTSTDIDTIEELVPLLASFTSVTSISPGTTFVDSFETMEVLAGYADQFPNSFSFGTVNALPTPNALLNRNIYAIVSDASALTGMGAATLSSQFGLFLVGTLSGDDAGGVDLTASPSAASGALIGTFDTKTGDFSGTFGDPGTFTTFKLAAVPEPSTALLSALGVLALLRRRRN